MVAHSPQRILQQFAIDQGATYAIEATCINIRDVESRYVGKGRENLLGLSLLYFWLTCCRKELDHQEEPFIE